ncbi:T9SS type A sorting domain-containing protein [Parabacteroides sp. ZJ-118]|uniref:T9SS type A sorting domain-containing protein n=1 Tax=Parabacteroides sp. ZJ-118 TaxID=2709398 RepID=UPI0013ED2A69|nr:T9SS type A sorting domain-containing protein [Parabacteroides sp. ZJ-118]
MNTFLRRFSLRLSLVAMILCLYAALPGQGLAWGQTGEEVGFRTTPDPVSYAFVYNSNEATHYSYFSVSGFTEGMAVRVQLADKANPNGIRMSYWANGSESMLELVDGGCWIPDEMVSHNFELTLTSSKVCDVDYTVSLYASKDMSAAPLATTSHTVQYRDSDDRPRIDTPDRIAGELNTDIPFTINVSQTGFLQGQPAQLKILLSGSYEGLTLSGQGLEKDPVGTNVYVMKIPSFTATQYTFTARATEACNGTYHVSIYDGDGNDVRGGTSASFVIPVEYSAADIAALEAIAAANPSSNDLRNFIANKDYLKDRSPYNNYNVGVAWNTETPSRVKSFFIDDYRTQTVSSLDVSGLTGLEELRLSGTRAKSLDLSALTKLERLDLNGNDSLTWFTVKFPDPLPENFWAGGSTQIMAGTPVDDSNSYATSGTEIDLSAYAEVNGKKSTYQWFRVTRREPYSSTEVTLKTVPGKEGAFIFEGAPGEYYQCRISNPAYTGWNMRTPEIKVARGSDDYSPVDIAALEKLAADNPGVTQLQEFVKSKGWEHENWDTYKDAVATDWSVGVPSRLTHLRIQLDWNSKDTISSLDLSAFTELKYFECERFMNIEQLDLSKNTKLEHLHLFSANLASLDLSHCPDLQYFCFGTQSIGEGSYRKTKLNTVNLTGCTKLRELYLEHSPMASLDISSFKQLNRLEIEWCPNLKVQGFESATQLEYLALPHTDQFADLLKNLPANIHYLYLQDTEYTLPTAEVAKNLWTLGLPSYVESLDMAQYPNLRTLEVGYGDSRLRYSTLKNYRQIRYNGRSEYQLTSPSHPQTPYRFENGDTIDLSSEAVIDGVETVFLWVNAKYRTEEKEALVKVPGRPGVFVLNSKEEGYGEYYCKMMNPKFCEITEINYRNGWNVETTYFRVETSVPVVFAESDVATLARIVDASSNKALQEWWRSGAWQTNENSSNAQAVWNNENPRRLTELYLYQMGNSFATEVDLSALDKLEVLSLFGNRVEKLVLPTNSTALRCLMLGNNPTLTSLIVSAYSELIHLNVANTGLTALDVSNNKQLTELLLNGTALDGVEESAPDIAAQLTAYGLPKSVTEIDLANFPALTSLNVDGSGLEFANVKNPRQLKADGIVRFAVGTVRPGGYVAYGETIDLSSQAMVGTSASHFTWVMEGDTIDHADSRYPIVDSLEPDAQITGHVTNPLFPGWTVQYTARIYTCDGDANLDKLVNVQDVTATVSYILRDSANMIPKFGRGEADVNYSNHVEIADVVGIVNIIRDQPITKAGMLRAETEAPVWVELDTDNFLTLSSQVPIAGIYLELVGATEELPLVGEAAKFLQAAHLNGDTLRVIGYSLDGRTIPSGKTRVLRMPAGVTLVGASFSDAKAGNLRAGGDAIVTSNAPIEAIERVDAISNYPNPFCGSTTFRYQLAEPADAVTIHVFSANGALAAVLNGLPGEVGENRHTAALTLPAGVYYYRLTAKAGRSVKASNTNILIIQ